MSAWPSISCTLLRSAPPESNCVAKQCRNVCGVTFPGNPMRPCPHCGSNDQICEGDHFGCNRCNATGPDMPDAVTVKFWPDGEYPTDDGARAMREWARDAWNRDSGLPSPACPRCGHGGWRIEKRLEDYCVVCGLCGSMGPEASSEEEAAEKWKERA